VWRLLHGLEHPVAVTAEEPGSIGVASFVGPFVVASAVAYFLFDWTGKASLIAGTALSTTQYGASKTL
jgi:Kef-type K+ transport system membrane component KefB